MNQGNNNNVNSNLNNNTTVGSPVNNGVANNIGTVSSSNSGSVGSTVNVANQVNGAVVNTPIQSANQVPGVLASPVLPTTPVSQNVPSSSIQPQVPLQVNTQVANNSTSTFAPTSAPISASVPGAAGMPTSTASTPINSVVTTPGAVASTGVVLETKDINSNNNNNNNNSNNGSGSVADSDPKKEAIEILSLDKKEKVNLLTPEQKENLARKREEAMREKENYKPEPVSKAKRILSILFIITLLGIVLFLPDINNFVTLLMDKDKIDSDDDIITTGVLVCTEKKVDDRYNIDYSYSFSYIDNKLDSLSYVETTVGDSIADSDDLNLRLENCKNLKAIAGGFAGINITCSLSGNTLIREQRFVFGSIDKEKVTAAYVEAGGAYPGQFEDGSSIDSIESNMKGDGYICERRK